MTRRLFPPPKVLRISHCSPLRQNVFQLVKNKLLQNQLRAKFERCEILELHLRASYLAARADRMELRSTQLELELLRIKYDRNSELLVEKERELHRCMKENERLLRKLDDKEIVV